MLGLIKDFAITALIIILNHWVYDVEDIIAYDFVVNFITKNHTLFLSTGILGSAGLLIFTLIEGLGLYKVTYGLSKLFVRICQFFITFLCTINIVFYWAMGMNLMRDSAYFLLFVLILIIGSSCCFHVSYTCGIYLAFGWYLVFSFIIISPHHPNLLLIRMYHNVQIHFSPVAWEVLAPGQGIQAVPKRELRDQQATL